MATLRGPMVVALALLLGARTGYAQAGSAEFHVGGGLVLPQGSFNDGFKTGWQGMAGLGFYLKGIPFLVRVDGFYGRNNGDESQVGSNVKTSLLGALLGGQYYLGRTSPVRPYLLGQIGVTHAELEVGQLDESEDKFTFAGGAGIMFAAGSLHVFIESKYLSVLTSNSSTNMIPILVGLQFSGVKD
ncbi:MAG TPA: outer membrane beta-barrel protein [Gemmatimonadales bacterium]|nr:outer membrane beta-barrel protein [Gemmatimonadales bacterium]